VKKPTPTMIASGATAFTICQKVNGNTSLKINVIIILSKNSENRHKKFTKLSKKYRQQNHKKIVLNEELLRKKLFK
jgi:hypothetical protein